MNNKAKKGKIEILILFTTSLIITISIIVGYNLRIGNDRLFIQIAKVVVTIVLMGFTLAGKSWAKYLLCFLFLLGGIWGIEGLSKSPTFAVYSARLFVLSFDLFFCFYLHFSPRISEYLYCLNKTNKPKQ